MMKIGQMGASLAAMLGLTSCSLKFQQEWREEMRAYGAKETGALTGDAAVLGPWEGRWETPGNGHSGKLKAIVKAPESEGAPYRFFYFATWSKVFAGAFEAEFPRSPSHRGYRFIGEQELAGFGTYTHDAEISTEAFEASFSKGDRDVGTFRLTRP